MVNLKVYVPFYKTQIMKTGRYVRIAAVLLASLSITSSGIYSDSNERETHWLIGILELMRFKDQTLRRNSKGNLLSSDRFSTSIHHAGFSILNVEKSDKFYKDIFGFRFIRQFIEGDHARPGFIYLWLPDCAENID